MISALNRSQDGNVKLTITIPTKRVGESYQKTLGAMAQKVTVKGFRPGKAPLKRAEQELGKTKIYEEVLRDLVPEVYLEAIKEHQLKPVVNPKVEVVTLEEGKDWQITATTCELPKVELGNYKEKLKGELASEKIWVPGKNEEKPSPEVESKKMDKIFKALLAHVKVQVPQILIDDEVNRMLSRLVDSTKRLGLTVKQYLSSTGKTSEQLRQEYHKQAEEMLKLEFILSSIAEEEKIAVKDEEVEKMIQAVPDEKTKKSFDNPAQRAYVRQLLKKRAVIDNLAKL